MSFVPEHIIKFCQQNNTMSLSNIPTEDELQAVAVTFVLSTIWTILQAF
jgi:hypothetical protein